MKKRMKNQEGMALVIALMILLILTLIGISTVGTASFGIIISGNQRLGKVAFYASEAGVQEALGKLPDTSPVARTRLGKESFYWSGSSADIDSPKGPKALGKCSRAGFDTSWEFGRFQVNATGEASGAMREVEVQLTYGPYGGGTQYN